MKAYLHQFRVSPKKANLVAALVRNKRVQEAIDILTFTPKKSAPVLKKLIQSAVANAENNFKQNRSDLYIKEIIVNEGPTYKRSMPVSRGRSYPILKRTSHITVKIETMEKTAKKSPELEIEKSEEQNEAKKPIAKAPKKSTVKVIKKINKKALKSDEMQGDKKRPTEPYETVR